MSLDQGGPAIIAYNNAHALFAIKQLKTDEETKSVKFHRFNSNHVVSLHDVFIDNDKNEYNLVYEYMDVSLEQVLGTPRGRLAAFEIAAICREVCY